MRWPFGPPHLTLKPSKKQKQKKAKTQKKTNKKTTTTNKKQKPKNKEGLGPSEVALTLKTLQ